MKKLPNWISLVLKIAGILNFLLAVTLAFFSGFILAILQQESLYVVNSFLWLQVAGIGFFVLGVGYFVTSYNTLRNSVALVMGLLANLLGLIFLPVHFGFFIFTSSILFGTMVAMAGWVAVLVTMLYYISKAGQAPQSIAYSYTEPLSKTLSRFRTQKGKSLLQLSNDQPILVIFLRHFGCTFCREALADIKRQKASIEEEGARLVFVHLASEEQALVFFEKTKLDDEHRISDPNGIMYNAFGLDRASFTQVLGWQSWVRRLPAIFRGHGIGPLMGDAFRMPGVFLINRGEIIKSYRHDYASDRPDYVSLASGEAA